MKRFMKSFSYAAKGIRYGCKGRNFRVELACALAALVLAGIAHVSRAELALVVLAIGLVLSMEATNSALEEICNKFHPEEHPHIALIKDLAAGAVLISSVTALAIGIIVFLPFFRTLL